MNKELSNYLEYESQILNGLIPCFSLLNSVLLENSDKIKDIIVSKRSGENVLEYLGQLNSLINSLEKLNTLPRKLNENERNENGIYYKLMKI